MHLQHSSSLVSPWPCLMVASHWRCAVPSPCKKEYASEPLLLWTDGRRNRTSRSQGFRLVGRAAVEVLQFWEPGWLGEHYELPRWNPHGFFASFPFSNQNRSKKASHIPWNIHDIDGHIVEMDTKQWWLIKISWTAKLQHCTAYLKRTRSQVMCMPVVHGFLYSDYRHVILKFH